ncbi:MAG: hypothetical protein KJ687_09255 [Proteobacteria bacterium]|nr:hypothetical protein [Pseudomonadota bacterium]
MRKNFIFFFILFLLIIIGCNNLGPGGNDQEGQLENQQVQIDQPVKENEPSATAIPTQTQLPTYTPTIEPVKESTPLPTSLMIISEENLHGLSLLAIWKDSLVGSMKTSGVVRYPKIAIDQENKILYMWDFMFSDGSIELWDIRTGKMMNSYGPVEDYVRNCDLSVDKMIFVCSGSLGDSIRFRQIKDSMQQIAEVEPLMERSGDYWSYPLMTAIKLDSDGQLAAAGTKSGLVRVYFLKGWSGYHHDRSHGSMVSNLAFLTDNSILFSAAENGSVYAWPAPEEENRDEEIIPVVIREEGDPVESMAISPDETRLTIQAGRDLSLYDFRENKQIWSTPLPEALLFDMPEEEYDPENEELPEFAYLAQTLTGRESLSFSPDGNLLACGTVDGDILFFNSSTGHLLLTFPAHRGSVLSLLFSDDGQMLISSGYDGSVQLWGVPED